MLINYSSDGLGFRSSVCVSIHITNDTPPGWQYSVAIFHGLNLSAFLFIFFAYGYMYTHIKATTKAAGTLTGSEIAAARKMTVIVLTDFCCWFPINVMGKNISVNLLHVRCQYITSIV